MKKVLSIFALLLALVTVSYAATQHSASVTLYEIVSVGSNKFDRRQSAKASHSAPGDSR